MSGQQPEGVPAVARGVTAAPPSRLPRPPGACARATPPPARSRKASAARYSSSSRSIMACAAAVEPLERAVGVPRLGIGGEQRQRDRSCRRSTTTVPGSWSGSILPQLTASAGRRAGEAAGVGARVGHLEEVVVAPLVDAEHLLDLRLGLEHEVLGAAAADDQHPALAAAALGLEHDGWRSRSRRRSRRTGACCRPAPARPRSCRSSCRPASWCRSAPRARAPPRAPSAGVSPSAFSRSRT